MIMTQQLRGHAQAQCQRPARRTRSLPMRVARPLGATASPSSADIQPAVIEVAVASPSGQQTFSLTIEGGEGEILRTALLTNKADLYNLWGKAMNCGGGGSCGTCVVEVIHGADLLSERTPAEGKKLKGKPSSWRLACQTVVGETDAATAGGKLEVRTQPKL